ncbi:hypothetical protein MK489_00935 [Myxococcota bacterium]|nr:hypothetical protein [Myxococcota bacterium]
MYVEGAGDRSILREWAYRLLPRFAKRLFESTVILGGRQPARALAHFHEEAAKRPQLRGLCLLDRDGTLEPAPKPEFGMEYFMWSRRHIESYVLVPDVIRRVMDAHVDAAKLAGLLHEILPVPEDEDAYRTLDAKRLLGRKGPLAQLLGRPVPLARVARATREHELHQDVHDLFALLRQRLGVIDPVRYER